MKTRLFARCLWVPLALAACVNGDEPAMAAETAATNALPPDITEQIRRFGDEIREQGQRIDRLYRILGPHLKEIEAETAAQEKEKEEDARLLMERIAELSGLGFSQVGRGSPAAPEFAVITGAGAIQIVDAQGKLGKKLRPPGELVTAVAFSPDGLELLAGTEGGVLLICDLATGKHSVIATNLGKIGGVAWLGKDRLVWGGTVRAADAGGKNSSRDEPAGGVIARESGKLLWPFRSRVLENYFSLAVVPDGSRLVVMQIPDKPRAAFVLDGATGDILQTCYDRPHGSGPLSVAVSPDGKTIAVGYAPTDIILWDASTGEQRKLLKGHSNWVVSLAFSADSRSLISGAGDSTARLWNTLTGEETARLRFPGNSTYVWSVGLSPKGDCAFALTQQGELVIARTARSSGASAADPKRSP